MIQEIQYKGMTAEPDDYLSVDGELEVSHNMLCEEGALRPIAQPEVVYYLPKGYNVVKLHRTSNYTHYIVQGLRDTDNVLLWFDAAEISGTTVSITDLHEIHYFSAVGEHEREPIAILDIEVLGNTLMVMAADGVHYCLWKTDTGSYKYLGTHLPELPLSFGLQGEAKTDIERNIFDNSENCGLINLPTSEDREVNLLWDIDETFDAGCKVISDKVMGYVNKFVKKEGDNKGKFIFPFLVRYAYRLYDGTHTMCSAPVLMLTSTGVTPIVFVTQTWYDSGDYHLTKLNATVKGVVFDLDYVCLDPAAKAALQEWSDIVQAVDIYVSAPIYTYDQAGRVKGLLYKNSYDDEYTVSLTAGVDESGNPASSPQPEVLFYRKTAVPPLLFSGGAANVKTSRFNLPTFNEERIKEQVTANSTFYLLKSLKLEDIVTVNEGKMNRAKIEVAEDYLGSLVNRERLEETDFDSHDQLRATHGFVYNSRLNLSGISKEAAQPFNPATVVPFCNYNAMQLVNVGLSQWVFAPNNDATTETFVSIEDGGKSMVLKSDTSKFLSPDTPAVFYFYPNTKAKEAVRVKSYPATDTEYDVITMPLEEHPMLNGAYYFAGLNRVAPETGWTSSEPTVPTVTTDNTVEIPNALYSSEVNNPFFFPATGIMRIGSGRIIGLSAAVRALSEGQFGQFPMYALCSDGVWALEVSSAGTFSARQPVTREVCSNAESITQLDTAVVFASDRGLIHLAGSTAECISDTIMGVRATDTSAYPHLATIIAGEEWQEPVPLAQYLDGCRMIYDYKQQRLIVYNPLEDDAPKEETIYPAGGGDPYTIIVHNYTARYSYAYVYSLRWQTWGMVSSNLAASLNSYPDAVAMTHDNKLVRFGGSGSTAIKGMLLTRPIKMGEAEVLKTIRTVLQRGILKTTDLKTVLYGTRDYFHWHLLCTSTTGKIRSISGTPYKAFRIVTLASLTQDKTLDGVTIEYVRKWTQQLK